MAKNYIEVFNSVLERREFRYSLKELADLSGLGTSQLSRFLNSKTDIPVSKFFQLINSMPPEFQEEYWAELLQQRGSQQDWWSLISTATLSDIEEILRALSHRYSELKRGKEGSQAEQEILEEILALPA
jgi:transcriptional regulator with XRE-family HTH domain